MANEASPIQKSVVPATQRTLGLTTDAIEKGALLALSGSNTVIQNLAGDTAKAFGGIAATEKVAADTSQTRMGCHMNGVWDLYCVGDVAIYAGDMLELSGTNGVRKITSDSSISGGAIVGYAQEDVAAGTAGYIATALIGGY